MNEQAALDRMLETENLTSELEDSDAAWLLDWGTRQVSGLIHASQDDQEARMKVDALMTVMRRINQIAAGSRCRSLQELIGEVTSLSEVGARVFGAAKTDKKPATIANELAGMSVGDALKTLTGWVAGAED